MDARDCQSGAVKNILLKGAALLKLALALQYDTMEACRARCNTSEPTTYIILHWR